MRYRAYLFLCTLSFLGMTVLLLPGYLFLWRTGEMLSLAQVVSTQRSDPRFCIYGTALHRDMFSYKWELYRQVHPAIALVGSSRVMPIRERFFTSSFVNLGGAADSVYNAQHILSLMLEEHTPNLLLIGADYWWFPANELPYDRVHPPLEFGRFSPRQLLLPLQWIHEGKLSLREMVDVIVRGVQKNGCTIGVMGMERREGFGPDGSYYYTSGVTGEDPLRFPAKFAGDLEEIRSGTKHFVPDSILNHTAVDRFISLIRFVQSHGVPTVVFFPPLAPEVVQALERDADRYAYIRKIFDALDAAHIPYLDFHNPHSIGASSCEFTDGIHAGDVAMSRMLLNIRMHLPAHAQPLLSRDVLEETVRAYAGFAMAHDDRVTELPETDFLHMGCKKRARFD